MSELADAWGRVTDWLTANAPVTAATLQPGASAAEVEELAVDLGLDLPAELREWFTLQGGVGYSLHGTVVPNLYLPLSAVESAGATRMLREVWAELGEQDDEYAGPEAMGAAGDDPAGTMTGMWIDAFVAIGDDTGGNVLFVDTRPGELAGCVTEYRHGDADTYGPRAPSLTAVVADVARALEAGGTTRLGLVAYVPRVTDGVLEWDVDAQESSAREAGGRAW